MRHTDFIKIICILVITAILGFAAPASADRGMGYGHHCGRGNHMPGWHHGGYGEHAEPGFGYRRNLSEEELQKLEKERLNFFEATKDLKAKLYQKGLEIRSELAKETPDTKKAAGLQKEISELKAELDQKRLAHYFNVRKINPDIGRGFRGGYGMMGPGMMGGGGRGGYGMMGPGMMGGGGRGGYGMMSRGGYGTGPGMMGYGGSMMGAGGDYAQRYGGHMGSLEEKDARKIVENYIRSTRNPNLKTGKIVDSGNAFRAQIITQDNSLVEEVLIDKASGSIRSAY